MKAFTLRLEENSLGKMVKELKRAVATGKPYVHEDTLYCSSMDTLLAVFTKAKLEVFAAIVKNRPQTLNELSVILDKDLGNLSRDCRNLEALGLIELRKDNAEDNRRVRPIAKYDQIIFDFSMPV